MRLAFKERRKSNMGLFDIFKGEDKNVAVVVPTEVEDTGNSIEDDMPNVAKDILTEILDLMGFFNVVKIVDSDKSFVSMEIKGDDLGRIIGKEGNTLAALQLLMRNMLSKKYKRPVSVQIDANSYKQKRENTLQNMALEAADSAYSENKQIELPSMTPWERRIIHLALKDNTKVKTESIGEDQDRKVIIYPNK